LIREKGGKRNPGVLLRGATKKACANGVLKRKKERQEAAVKERGGQEGQPKKVETKHPTKKDTTIAEKEYWLESDRLRPHHFWGKWPPICSAGKERGQISINSLEPRGETDR